MFAYMLTQELIDATRPTQYVLGGLCCHRSDSVFAVETGVNKGQENPVNIGLELRVGKVLDRKVPVLVHAIKHDVLDPLRVDDGEHVE